MGTIVYNKAVRDRIPEIIRAAGKDCTVEQVSPERWLELLSDKMGEEVAEYQANPSLEELADVLEIMQEIVRLRGDTWVKLTEVQVDKRNERGAFAERFVLRNVIG